MFRQYENYAERFPSPNQPGQIVTDTDHITYRALVANIQICVDVESIRAVQVYIESECERL